MGAKRARPSVFDGNNMTRQAQCGLQHPASNLPTFPSAGTSAAGSDFCSDLLCDPVVPTQAQINSRTLKNTLPDVPSQDNLCQFLTIQQVAESAQVHNRTIRRLVKSGALHSVQFGREIRISKASLVEFSKRGGQRHVHAMRKAGKPDEAAEGAMGGDPPRTRNT